ncbi:hypothetical protein BJX99DRAFT_256822 [Aspergillus californicus]
MQHRVLPSAPLSIPLADPPMFSDGISLKFRDWMELIETKLSVNSDHFPTPISRLHYTTGEAQQLLCARVRRTEYFSRITDSREAIEFLRLLYGMRNNPGSTWEKFYLHNRPNYDRFQTAFRRVMIRYLLTDAKLSNPFESFINSAILGSEWMKIREFPAYTENDFEGLYKALDNIEHDRPL